MGADGGFHALHSCIGGGAHYACLKDPLAEEELIRVAKAVSTRRSTVIVVAEGYARALRKELAGELAGVLHTTTSGRPEMTAVASASAFLHWQLTQTGHLSGKKVVCEPFSRDIRGVSPNNLDTFLSQIMARQVVKMAQEDVLAAMPSVHGGKVGSIRLSELATDNSVDPETVLLSDNL